MALEYLSNYQQKNDVEARFGNTLTAPDYIWLFIRTFYNVKIFLLQQSYIDDLHWSRESVGRRERSTTENCDEAEARTRMEW